MSSNVSVAPVSAWTADHYLLQGVRWQPPRPEGTVIHVHGLAGHPSRNPWIWDVANAVCNAGWAFVAGSNRGTGVLWTTATRNGTAVTGATTELVAEAPLDVSAWIAITPDSHPTVLTGHSLGATKVALTAATDLTRRIRGAVLLAPVDLIRYTRSLPGFAAAHDAARHASRTTDPFTWAADLGDGVPLSAATLLERAERGAVADVLNSESSDRAATLFGQLDIPVHLVAGTDDEACGDNVALTLQNLAAQNANVSTCLLHQTGHQFVDAETRTAAEVAAFIRALPS